MPPHVFKEQLRRVFNIKLTPQVCIAVILGIHVLRKNIEGQTVPPK